MGADHLADARRQCVDGKGLCHHFHAGGKKAVRHRGVLRIAGDEQNLKIRPLLARSGGTLPIVPALVDQGIPTILSGIALPESNIHSPNERLLAEYLPLGIETAKELFRAWGGLAPGAG